MLFSSLFSVVILSTYCWKESTAFLPKQHSSSSRHFLGRSFDNAVVTSSGTTTHLYSSWDGGQQDYEFQQQQGYQHEPQQENQNLLAARSFLQQNYPYFYSILEKNDQVWKAIGEDNPDAGEYGFTIFAPSDDAIRNLGETKQSQLLDPRNLETTQKLAGYHVIGETVTAEQIFNSG
jgi:uncharacterized surface protein with fasciclin (FAS1) repeats